MGSDQMIGTYTPSQAKQRKRGLSFWWGERELWEGEGRNVC